MRTGGKKLGESNERVSLPGREGVDRIRIRNSLKNYSAGGEK